MKHINLSARRDADFAQCLRTVARRYEKDRRNVTPETIIAEAMASKPQRYYLSFSTIVTNLSRIRKSGFFSRTEECDKNHTRRQWHEINRAVNRYLARNKGATLTDAITHVICFSRPERFYISDKKAHELFRRTFRREYRYVL